MKQKQMNYPPQAAGYQVRAWDDTLAASGGELDPKRIKHRKTVIFLYTYRKSLAIFHFIEKAGRPASLHRGYFARRRRI
ncbi:MAG: hypothetical protein Q7J31_02345, partial [Syntrophales bacterium]|nr:hypothetical protein [Syntrophales bacterium]